MPYFEPRVLHDRRAQRLASRAIASSWANAATGMFLMAAFCGSAVDPGMMYGVLRWIVLAVFVGATIAALYARAIIPAAVLAVTAIGTAIIATALQPPSIAGAGHASGSTSEWLITGGLVLVVVLAVVAVRADRAAGHLEAAAVEAQTLKPAEVRPEPQPAPVPAPQVVGEEPTPARVVVDTIRPDLLPAMYRTVPDQSAPVLVPAPAPAEPPVPVGPAAVPAWTVESVHVAP